MSQLGTLNWKDLLKGLVVAMIMSILTAAYEIITKGDDFDYKKVGIIAIGAGLSYLIKNLGSDSNGNVLGITKN